jgi:hypothetical protein
MWMSYCYPYMCPVFDPGSFQRNMFVEQIYSSNNIKLNKLCGLSPQANYTYQPTVACRRS